MVICVGCDPYKGNLKVYNSETNAKNLFIVKKCDPENIKTISTLFEFIKTYVTKEFIHYFCVYMGPKYKNEFRKKFIEIAKENAVFNVRIISVEQANLCEAIKELSVSPKMNKEIWIFYIDENDIRCLIWKFEQCNGWKLKQWATQAKTENNKDVSPMLEDFKKLKEKMNVGIQIPYILVFHGNYVVNQNEFKVVFPGFRRIIFQEMYDLAEWTLKYARFMSGHRSFLKYKSESLLTYAIQLEKAYFTEILRVNLFQVLPLSKTTIINFTSNETIIASEGGDITSILPLEDDGEYLIDLNIDFNGIFDFNFKSLDSNVEDTNSFAIPPKLSNYDSDLNAIGIDLGTTEFCAAVIRRNGPDFVVLDGSSRTMPSYIAYDEAEPKCGQVVVDRMRYKFQYSVYDTKRILGKKIDEIITDPLWPFKIISSSENNVEIEVETLNGKDTKTCEEITANLIAHIRNCIQTYQGKKLTEAVITIPSEFSDQQKTATLIAAEMAGLDKIHFLPESIAAAFAYFTELNIPKNSNILICDCGGGTVDICLAKINNQMLDILNFDGDSQLGGRDFDTILFNHFNAILKHKFGIDVMQTKRKYLLKQKCQNIKHTLSAQNEDWIDVSSFEPENEKLITVSRKEFEEMSASLLLKIKNVICRAVSNAKLEKSQIDYVFQIGGGCKMPMIKEMLKEIFPNSKHECSLYPDWVVAHGAALYAYQLKTNPPRFHNHRETPVKNPNAYSVENAANFRKKYVRF